MQPMGRLSMHSKCLDFFSFKFWVVGGWGDLFHLSFVPNMFPSSSQWISIRFPRCSLGSQCVPQWCSQQQLPLISHVLPKVLPFSPIWVGQRGRHSIFPENLLFWGASIVSTFFCDEPIKLAHCKKKKVGLVKHPPTNQYETE